MAVVEGQSVIEGMARLMVAPVPRKWATMVVAAMVV